MDHNAILAKATAYVAAEPTDLFSNEIQALIAANQQNELYERFFSDLEFGTGGMRGVLGGGSNRMNTYNIRRATQGLANYVKKSNPGTAASAVIAYDSRRFSSVFALETALVFCANGITTYLFTALRPTPELSFAVRQLKATTGIVITASHNPKEYNGYKAYWSDGGQVVPPHDKAIVREVQSVTTIQTMERGDAENKGLLKWIDRDIDDRYIALIKSQSLQPQLVAAHGRSLKVVYTPLHGTGAMPVERTLSEMGIKVIMVPQQKEPDTEFSTIESPNPEEGSALAMALDLAKREKADLVIGTDPDADRIGIAVPDKAGEFVLVTGNQLGVLLCDYILSIKREQNALAVKSAIIKTIVTTELQRRIAERYGVECIDVLTGFKFIAEKIKEFEQSADPLTYLFGGEESYGYLVGTGVRDKDAVGAAAMTAEMTLYHRSRGLSLLERLYKIYQEYGYFEETLVSNYFKGASGITTMNAMMDNLRTAPPHDMHGLPVAEVRDYRDGTTFNSTTAQRTKNITLPSSNVLQFVLSDGSVVTARPSGTEPKIKFYASCCTAPGMTLSAAQALVSVKIAQIKQWIQEVIAAA